MDIYVDHFGLSARPFSLAPDPYFIYWTPSHRRAWTMLEYGIMTRAPITLMTGEIGAGKTTLLHHFLSDVDRDLRVGLIANAHGDRGELLQWVLQALDQDVDQNESYVSLFGRLQKFLIAEYAAGRRVVLIFDEAQNLSRETLEELRMLTNINSGEDELLQLVLVGQPELRDIVRQPDLVQFAQRIAANCHLPAMGPGDVSDYVRHRLDVVDGDPEIFSDGALRIIHAATGGVPRLVNQLCDLSMLYSFEQNRLEIDSDIVQQVLDDGVFFGGGTGPLRLIHRVDDPAGRTEKKVE